VRDRFSGGHDDDQDATAEGYDRIADYDARRDRAVYGGDAFADGGDYAGDYGGDYGGSGRGGYMSGFTSRVQGTGRSLWSMVDEHPMASGLMAVALGAAIGASLPSTEAEDEWLGQYRDQMIEQARQRGGETVNRVTGVAREAAMAGVEAARDTARDSADREGLTGSQGGSTSGSMGGGTMGSGSMGGSGMSGSGMGSTTGGMGSTTGGLGSTTGGTTGTTGGIGGSTASSGLSGTAGSTGGTTGGTTRSS